MAQQLSAQDKFEIFDVRDVRGGAVVRRGGKRTFVFEFLQDFSANVLHSRLASLDVDFQVRILKQKSQDALDELESAEWFEPAAASSGYVFSFSPQGEKQNSYRMGREALSRYELGGFVYRHYVAFTDSGDMGPGFESAVSSLVSGAADAGIPVRRLTGRELVAYVFESVNFPDKFASGLSRYSPGQKSVSDAWIRGEIDEGAARKIGHAAKGLEDWLWRKAEDLAKAVENVFFHKEVPEVSSDVMEMFSQSMFKHGNSFQVGGNYRGGVVFKGVPRSDFNVLAFLFRFMENGDSVVMNLYPGDYHRLSYRSSESKGAERAYRQETEDSTVREGETYLQLVAVMNAVSQRHLDERISKFQTAIGNDFLATRIGASMSRFAETSLGVGQNSLNHETSYDSGRLARNFLF